MKLFFLFNLIYSIYGHLNGVSTCTDPLAPGNISFIFSTYHSYSSVVPPGTVHIQAPSGIISTFSLAVSKRASPEWTSSTSMTGSEWDSNIKSSFNYSSDVSCSHFGDKTANSSIYPSLTANESQSCHSNGRVTVYYQATLSNAVSGTYTVWITGTDAVLSYSGNTNAITPCEDSDLVLDLIVSDGLSKCMSAPPSIINGNAIPSVCSNVISGYRCQVSCSSGYYATGYSQCSNGSYVGDFRCYDTIPCIISTMTTDLNTANISTLQISGISGSGCGYSILNGTKCDVVCDTGYNSAGSIVCDNGKFISESASCNNITLSPTVSPTVSPTALPTVSPTVSPTLSPTDKSIIYFTQTNYFYFMFPVCVISAIYLIIHSLNSLKSCFYTKVNTNDKALEVVEPSDVIIDLPTTDTK